MFISNFYRGAIKGPHRFYSVSFQGWQRRQVVNKAEKRAKAAQESKAEEPVKKQAKKAKNEAK